MKKYRFKNSDHESYREQIKVDLFSGEYKIKELAKKYKVSEALIYVWKREFKKELLNDEKTEFVEVIQEGNSLLVDSKSDDTPPIVLMNIDDTKAPIDVFKDNGLQVCNAGLVKMYSLINLETDIRKIAIALEKVLPYVLPKIDGNGSKGNESDLPSRLDQMREKLKKKSHDKKTNKTPDKRDRKI